ncbi:MAG: hydantoinase B/oxoprolinase family protein [Planctomycetota bacterium]
MAPISPYELQVFGSLFAAVADEMGVTLMRSAFSPNIKERRDFSCAVFDDRGRMVAHAAHIPVHLGSTPLSVRAAIAARPLEPGDMVLLNDPFAGGTHLPDITLVTPVFVEEPDLEGGQLEGSHREGGGGPAFYVANRAHHADVGGMAPGSMALVRESCQEGLRLPPVALVKRGILDADLMDVILANVRTPRERRADIAAQVAANLRGARRLREMVPRYGLKRLARACAALLDYGERSMRTLLRTIPQGTYEFEDALDDDGIEVRPVTIRVSIRVGGGRARVSFAGSAPQTSGPMNANLAVTRSAVLFVFRSLAGGDLPANDGALRPIEIVAPEGTVVNACWPAAVAAGNVETSQRLVDVLMGALSKALPRRLPAASQGTMNNLSLGGVDPEKGVPFAYYETVGGGGGASAGRDGTSGVHAHMTNTLNTPVEALENTYPLRVIRTTLRRGSGGEGEHRGGDGIIREIETLTEVTLSLLAERRRRPAFGAAGGEDGKPGQDFVVHRGRRRALPSKVECRLDAGDRVVVETPGGGGWGSRSRRMRR